MGVVANLPHDAIMGRDFPHWGESSSPVKEASPEGRAECPVFPLTVLAGKSLEPREEPKVAEKNLRALEFSELEIHKENFVTEQLKDPNLTRARKNVVRVNGELVNPNERVTYPHFMMERDLFYW